MLIKRIELKNFRYVEHETVDLPENELFIFLGKNGSSKSTFLWAVPFCFYGFSDWTLKNTLKWGKNEGYVKIYFEINGNKYIAERHFNKTSSSFKLKQIINDKIKDIGGGLNKEAEETFQQVFPVPMEVFLQVVTRVQTDNTDYQLGSFCSATPKGMFDIIKHYVEVVKIEKYAKVNDEEVKRLRDKKTRLESALETSQRTIEDLALKEIKEEDIKKLDAKIEDIKEGIKTTKKRLEAAKEYETNWKKYKEAKEFIEKYSDIKKYYKKWDKLRSIEEPEVKFDEEKLAAIEEKVEESEEKISNLKEKLPELFDKEFDLESINDEINEYKEKQMEYRNKKKELKKKLDHLENGKCPECNRKFRSVEKRIPKTKEQLENLESFGDKIEELNNKYDKVSKTKQKNEQKIKKINNSILETTEKVSDLKEKKSKMEDSKEKTNEWEKKKEFRKEYPYDIHPDKLNRQYENKKETVEILSDIETQESPGSVENIKEGLEDKEEKSLSLKTEKNNLKDKKEKYEYHSKKIEEAKDKLETVSTNLEHHLQLSKVYSRTGAPHFMIKEFLYYLQQYANEYLDRFTKGRISIEFKTNHNSKSKPIELIFYDADRNNSPRPYSTFSRGEKTRVALSVEFLGMGRVFSNLTNINLDTGLIDEVYGLDEEGQEEFAEILSELSGTRKVMGGVVCFNSMAQNFEKIIKVEDGQIIRE
jgi:DNA repair exonuclease SbcCD ATPase subunit